MRKVAEDEERELRVDSDEEGKEEGGRSEKLGSAWKKGNQRTRKRNLERGAKAVRGIWRHPQTDIKKNDAAAICPLPSFVAAALSSFSGDPPSPPLSSIRSARRYP